MLKYNYEYSRILEQRNIKINQPSEILCRMLNLPANIGNFILQKFPHPTIRLKNFIS